jgi:ribosomal protein S18 acetylase RimI-like enzyme
MKIRQAQASDLKSLSEIYVKVYTYFDIGEYWTSKTAYNMLKYFYEKQPDLCLVAETKNKLIGGFFAGIKPWVDGNHLFDGELFVDPFYQKKGIGKQLSLELYVLAIKNHNVKSFDLLTFKDRDFPLSWYKKQGFTEMTQWTIIYGNPKKVLSTLKKMKVIK